MTLQRKLLLETLQGHIALLGSTHPRKASSPVVKRTRIYVDSILRPRASHGKRAAA
jgi:hypothetical protein